MNMSATEAWLRQLKKCVDDGEKCGNTLELLSSSLSFDMNRPIVDNLSRKVNYGFMFGEAVYITAGQSNLSYLERHIKKFGDYSDMYPFQQGSYGPPFVEQVRYVVENLMENESSRQAVMTIWRPNPRRSKDIPCTIALQFLIRDDKLHTIVTMRSSDIFTGLIYDMFCFSAMSAVVLAYLELWHVKLGTCWINAGSSHLYEKDMPRVKALTENDKLVLQYVEWPRNYAAIMDWLEDMEEAYANLRG